MPQPQTTWLDLLETACTAASTPFLDIIIDQVGSATTTPISSRRCCAIRSGLLLDTEHETFALDKLRNLMTDSTPKDRT